MPNRTTESRRYRDEFPPLIQTSTRSSEQGGIVTEASYSSTAATRSAIPGLSAMPNRTTERRYFADNVNEPGQAQENENQHRNITGRQGGAVAVRSEQASHSAMINNTNSFREEAEDHLNKMIEYKRRAKTSGKKKKGEFIKLAKVERKLMEEADRKAVELILEKGSPGFPHCSILDLHRLYIKEALPLVDRFLQTNMKLRDKVFIITGKGDHSKGPRSTLRDAIMEYLPEKGHRFREDAKKKGEFTVYFVERRR